MSKNLTQHLTDELFVEYSMDTLNPAVAADVASHLDECRVCSDEAVRMKQSAAMWSSASAIDRLQARISAVLKGADSAANRVSDTTSDRPMQSTATGLAAFLHPFVVSLRPLLRPQGAYGATVADESTIEFYVTQDGKVVEGLRGLLKRVNREYYVRIFPVDPGARSEFGNRKAVISISDTYQDNPILQRRIDVGVTVLLGTDFRLTENSSLAVEMLPAFH